MTCFISPIHKTHEGKLKQTHTHRKYTERNGRNNALVGQEHQKAVIAGREKIIKTTYFVNSSFSHRIN